MPQNKPTADEVVSTRHIRTFIQFGSARPGNVAQYAGQDGTYVAVEGLSVPELGSIEPRYVHDPNRPGLYRLVGRAITPGDLPTVTIRLLERHGGIPQQLQRRGCSFNLYQNVGKCVELSDFTGGWANYVLVLAGGLVTDKDLGTRTTWDSDDLVEDSLSVTLTDVFPVGSLSFGEVAGPQVDREIVDIVYGTGVSCGDCGKENDGSQNIYALALSSGAGSPGIPSEVVYTLNGGASWLEKSIDGIGATANATAIDIAGDKLIVVVQSENAYYWSQVDKNGVPGTFTRVTMPTSAGREPTDVVALNAREVFFSGQAGTIYRSTNIVQGAEAITTGTAQNLTRIHAIDDVIIAGGANATVVTSTNKGKSWAVATAPFALATTAVTAVAAVTRERLWVGGAGRAVYSIDGGLTWAQSLFSGAGAGTVRDIVFLSEEVGFILHDNATPTGRIFSTWNGGQDWTNLAPRITNLPTANRYNRLAAPDAHISVAANNVAVGGLGGGGTDGIVALGIAGLR